MPTRRILLLDVPRMLSDLVRDVVAEDDALEVVGELARVSGPEPVTAVAPDLILVGTGSDDGPPDACRAVFEERPHLTVLSVGGGEDVLWELAPRRVALGELSRDALRAALHEHRAWSWSG